MGTERGFSLIELAVVLVVLGVLIVGISRVLPSLNSQKTVMAREEELRSATGNLIEKVRRQGELKLFPAPDTFTNTQGPKYTQYLVTPTGSNIPPFVDSKGKGWGYMPAFNLFTNINNQGACARVLGSMITVLHCLNDNCTINVTRTNIALVTFSNDSEFLTRITITPEITGGIPFINDVNYIFRIDVSGNVGKMAGANMVFSGGESNFIAYTFPEMRELLGCTTQDTRAYINPVHTLPAAVKGRAYGPVGGINFVNLPQVSYCFQKGTLDGSGGTLDNSFKINGITFQADCTANGASWVKDDTAGASWALTAASVDTVGIQSFTGFAKISSDSDIITHTFNIPVSPR